MKLYEYLVAHDEDFDVWDTEVDDCVTICLPYLEEGDEGDDYDRFIIEVTKKVDYVDECPYGIIADWYGFLNKNRGLLAKHAREFWDGGMDEYDGEEDDDFICDWISHIHYMCAGYGNDKYYAELLKLVNECVG